MHETEEVRDMVRVEIRENLEEMQDALLEMEQNAGDQGLVNQVFRCLHTVKGIADLVGFSTIAALAHEAESAVDLIREKKRIPTRTLFNLLFEVKDLVLGQLNSPDSECEKCAELTDRIGRYLTEGEPSDGAAPDKTEPVPEEMPELGDSTADTGESTAPSKEAAGGLPEDSAADPATQPESGDASDIGGDSSLEFPSADEFTELYANQNDSAGDSAKESFPDSGDGSSFVLNSGSGDAGESQLSSDATGAFSGPVPAEYVQDDPTSSAWLITLRPNSADYCDRLDPEAIFEDLRKLGPVHVFPLSGEDAACCPGWEVLVCSGGTENELLDMLFFAVDGASLHIAPIADPEGWLAEWRAAQEAGDSGGEAAETAAPSGESVQTFDEDLEPGVSGAEVVAEDHAAPGVVLAETASSNMMASNPPDESPHEPPSVSGGQSAQAAEFSQPVLAGGESGEGSSAGESRPSGGGSEPPSVKGAKGGPGGRRRQGRDDEGGGLRVSTEKLDQLIDLVGELVTAQSRLNQIAGKIGDQALFSVAEEFDRLGGALRDTTLGIQMVPFGTSFRKYRRLIQDICRERGVKAKLVSDGGATEIDRTVMSRLEEPLDILMELCMRRSIEPPESRLESGKSAEAQIHLSAEQSAGHVHIVLEDDGAGADDAFVQQALDGALRHIDAMRGSIERHDTAGNGSGHGLGFSIKLPLTLAIIEGLVVRSGEELFILPLAVVEECLELSREERGDGKRILNLRGEIVPYVRLRDWLDIKGAIPEIEQVVVTTGDGTRTGIAVDEVIGQQQTVIKQLGRVFSHVEELSGAAVQGDGSMAIILDIPLLTRMARSAMNS